MEKHGKVAVAISAKADRLKCLREVLGKEGWLVQSYLVRSDQFLPAELTQPLELGQTVASSDLLVVDLEIGGDKWLMNYALAARYQLPTLPVVAMCLGRFEMGLEAALADVGITMVSWKYDFMRRIHPAAGDRRVRHLGWPNLNSRRPDLAPLSFDLPVPGISDSDPAWIKQTSGGMSWNFLPCDDPRLDLPLPPLWTDLSTPPNNGDLVRLQCHLQIAWPDFWQVPEGRRAWTRQWCLATAEALTVLAAPERSHVLVATPTIGCHSYWRSGHLGHAIAHTVGSNLLSDAELAPFLPGIKAVADRLFMGGYQVERDESQLWLGYQPGGNTDNFQAYCRQRYLNPYHLGLGCGFEWI